ncbi:MAG: hypothetical protein ACJ8F3_12145 [Xanthobacteraceae bacterium]
MTSNIIHEPIDNRISLQNRRSGPRRTLNVLVASALLAAPVMASNGALAFGPPPPPPGIGGPPPGLGGPPPGLAAPRPGFGGLPHAGPGGIPRPGLGGGPRVGGPGAAAASHFGGHGAVGNLRGSSAVSNEGRSGAYRYGRNGWRYGSYGGYVSGSDSTGYSSEGCTYTYSYSRNRRILTCTTD